MIDYSERKIGEVWTAEDHALLRDHLRRVDELAMQMVAKAQSDRRSA